MAVNGFSGTVKERWMGAVVMSSPVVMTSPLMDLLVYLTKASVVWSLE